MTNTEKNRSRSSGVLTGDRKIVLELMQAWSAISRTKGAQYAICWLHRISGCLLVVYVLLHINTLAALADPEVYARKAEFFSGSFMVFLEWLLALPVIFHCLNGGRVMVYELFDTALDARLSRVLFWLCGGYMILLGYFMIRGDQQVSAHFFWVIVVIASLSVSYLVFNRIRRSRIGIFWKMQRMTAAFLFLMVPAHMIFMHLNPQNGKDAAFIIERINQPFVAVVNILLVLSILYHCGYGVIGIVNDYLKPGQARTSCMIGVILILSMFGFQGIRLILSI